MEKRNFSSLQKQAELYGMIQKLLGMPPFLKFKNCLHRVDSKANQVISTIHGESKVF